MISTARSPTTVSGWPGGGGRAVAVAGQEPSRRACSPPCSSSSVPRPRRGMLPLESRLRTEACPAARGVTRREETAAAARCLALVGGVASAQCRVRTANGVIGIVRSAGRAVACVVVCPELSEDCTSMPSPFAPAPRVPTCHGERTAGLFSRSVAARPLGRHVSLGHSAVVVTRTRRPPPHCLIITAF